MFAMKSKRRVSCMVLTKSVVSASDGPRSSTYTSPRPATPITSTVASINPKSLSRKRMTLRVFALRSFTSRSTFGFSASPRSIYSTWDLSSFFIEFHLAGIFA